MSLVPNLALSGASANQGYVLSRSLRFRSSASAYLNRTPASATNRQIFTWSGWVKRGIFGVKQTLAYQTVSATYADPSGVLFFAADDTLEFSHFTSTYDFRLVTTQVFRDPSAWYHIAFAVDTTQATASNRVKLYINGVQVTAFSTATYPSLNFTTAFNNNSTFFTGVRGAAVSTRIDYFDGYLAELNWIDGQALTPSSFGQTDPVSGVWQPIKYAGTYGTNGFYLPFTDNTSATTLAYDKSGNGNNWTPNNISMTAGTTYDSMLDVPTLTSKDASNFCVLNPLDTGSSVDYGNLRSASGNAHQSVRSTIQFPSSGLWYGEAVVTTATSASNAAAFGVMLPSVSLTTAVNNLAGAWCLYAVGNKTINNNGSATTFGTGFSAGDVIQIAIDTTNNRAWFGQNNVWFDSAGGSTGNPSSGTNPSVTGLPASITPFVSTYTNTVNVNFGQRPFTYTPPTGFVALNTFNLPDPTIKKPNQYMDATTYTGTSATQTVTNAGGFQPDLVWVKDRSGPFGSGWNHVLEDAVRGFGTGKKLASNTTGAEGADSDAYGYISGVTSSGFTLTKSGTGLYDYAQTNYNGATYVGWQWKKGATPGFDIVTYTGTGSNATISHSLGVAPKMIIVKNRDSSIQEWIVYHASFANATNYLKLNTTDSVLSAANVWNSTAPTSSVFSVGSSPATNGSANRQLAYLFAEIAGYSKFGSYTGNGSANGPFVYCGFRPKYVMVKRTDTTGEWDVYDTSRDTYNAAISTLFPYSSNAEYTSSTVALDIVSNGFKWRTGTDVNRNANGGTYIYAAFAENPFKYSNAR